MSLQEALSDKEENAIQELQLRVKNCLTPGLLPEKLLYYRFLKARNFNVDKAEQMLRKHIAWRKVNQIDTILEDFTPIEFFSKYLEPSIVGFDKDGDLVRFSAAGKIKILDLMKCMTYGNFMKHWFWFAENSVSLVEKENKRMGRNAYMVTMIFDMEKMPFATAVSKQFAEMSLRFLTEYQDNYPERMKCTICINSPPYFMILFSILKTIMSPATLGKFHIYGNSGWKEKLLEIMDADDLPAFLGGNRTDPDGNPLCRTFIKHGGKIPDFYYLSEEDKYFKDSNQVTKVIISARDKEEIHISLTELNSLLEWEFYVKGKDIGFGIYAEPSKFERTEIIPIQKYDTSEGCERGSYKCRSPGKYIVIFDNSYSWMNAKEVEYRISVVKPKL